MARHVSIERLDTGGLFEEDVDIVVAAQGFVNNPKWPNIAGWGMFKGETMHSAAWNQQ